MKRMKLFLLLVPTWGYAQQNTVTLAEAVDLAMKNNPGVQAASHEVRYQKQLKKSED